MKSLQLIRNHKDYAWLLTADVINSIGATFTSVLIYYSLDTFDAPAWWFTFAYLAFIVPAYFGALLAEKIGKNFHLASVTIIANLFSLVFLAVTIYGFLHKQLWLLLASEVAISFAMGMIAPFQTYYQSQRFYKSDFDSITVINTFRFGIEKLLGFAVGSWMVSVFVPAVLFMTDALTYLVSSLIILLLIPHISKTAHQEVSSTKRDTLKALALVKKPTFSKIPPMKSLSQEQQRLFWLMPMIAVMGLPIMCLGPVLTGKVDTSNLAISGVLLFLLARITGQFLGPMVTKFIRFERLKRFRGLLPICALVYFTCYYFASMTSTLGVMIALVILAHFFSNIAGMTAHFALLDGFSRDDSEQTIDSDVNEDVPVNIESVRARQDQYGTVLGFISAIMATAIFSEFGLAGFFGYVGLIWLAICWTAFSDIL